MGLYLAPPANAAVFAVDEKPQIQALQRTAPVLPMIPGTPERRSHDYVRHGTIDLFAALNTATGKVIGKLPAQHRATGFRDFPGEIDRQADPGLAIHVICGNLSAHKAPAVHRWLLAHLRRAACARRRQAHPHRTGIIEAMSKSSSSPFPSDRFPVTVTQLPVTRCHICRRTVAYRPGSLSEVLTGHYRRVHPEALGLPPR